MVLAQRLETEFCDLRLVSSRCIYASCLTCTERPCTDLPLKSNGLGAQLVQSHTRSSQDELDSFWMKYSNCRNEWSNPENEDAP